MPFVLSIFLSCILSLIVSLRALGFDGFTFGGWMQAWGLFWIVVFPVLFMVFPIVRRIVAALVEKA